MTPPDGTMRDATVNGKTPGTECGYMDARFPPIDAF
jgi:hypothetical protein